ncbi:MAG: transporter, partial [Rhizorhabdus sp.]|nr:transporter [Rhizorhabdus sp.]
AIAWGLAALVMGNLADRVGRRSVLVGSMLVFSALIGLSGLAAGLASLVLIRILMGLADGAFTPASIAATMEASRPDRRGRNIGLQQMTALLFGLGFAPLLIPPLLHIIDWHWIFVLFAPPGALLAWLTWRALPAHVPAEHGADRSSFQDWGEVVRYRNVLLGMGLMLVWLTSLVTLSAFMPSYMLDHLHMSFADMGTSMSAIGLGGATGTILLPWLSDHIGRKAVMLGGTITAAAGLVALSLCKADVLTIFACLFVIIFCVMALITLTVGPLCQETVPSRLAATASGLVIAVGELFGGGLVPILGGHVAKTFGIGHVLWLPIGFMVAGIILSLMTRETAAKA